MDFSKYLFRCSSLGDLMSDSKDGITAKQLETIEEYKRKPKLTDIQRTDLLRLIAKRDKGPLSQLGDTCVKKLVEIYITERFGRVKNIVSKYLEKGLDTEEDSLTLYSEVKKIPYFKNTVRLNNDYITGEPDTFEGPSIKNALRVIDFKGSWDVFTFFQTKAEPIDKGYDYQLNGYCDLTDADTGLLAYCLNDTPSHLIEREINNLKYKLGIIDADAHPGFSEACDEIRRHMTFQDIPKPERIIEYPIYRSQKTILSIYDRVRLCRIWLNEFAYKQSKSPAHEQLSVN